MGEEVRQCGTLSILAGIKCDTSVGILEQSMGARNRVGIGLSYRPAWPHRLAESIPGILKSIKIPFLVSGKRDKY